MSLVVAALAAFAFARRRSGDDLTTLWLGALATAATGPAGSLGAVIAGIIAPARAGTTKLLDAWYERIAHSVTIDPVEQVCTDVAIGRAITAGTTIPRSFSAVMRHGTIGEQQAMLGLVARGFDIEYLPALRVAIESPEPVIRVQAAAVATRVQVEMTHIIERWSRRTDDAGGAARRIARFDTDRCLPGLPPARRRRDGAREGGGDAPAPGRMIPPRSPPRSVAGWPQPATTLPCSTLAALSQTSSSESVASASCATGAASNRQRKEDSADCASGMISRARHMQAATGTVRHA